MKTRAFKLWLFLIALTGQASAAQTFGERIEVNLTNVNVVVVDRTGAHVHGLTQDDFEVIDSGVPQALTNFAEVRGGATADSADVATSDRAAPLPTGTAHPVSLLVLFDDQHMQLKTRERAVEAVKRFLEARKGESLRVVVLCFNGMHTSRALTGDAGGIAKGLDRFVAATPPNQLGIQSERRHLMELLDGARDPDQAFGPVITWANSVRNDNVRTLLALQSSVAALSGFEGRKILLFVTEGIPQRAGAELFRRWADKFRKNADLQAMEFDMSRQLGEVARSANSSGVTLYTLNVSGTAAEAFEMNNGLRLREAEELRSSRQDALDFLAEQTGGTAIRNQNEFDAPLAAVGEDSRDYYSLAYRTPAGKSPSHKIEVRVKKAGLRVRTPQEYAVLSADQKTRAQVEAMFVMPPPDANPLGVIVARKDARDASAGTRVVPFLIRIPRDKLTTVTGGHVTLYVAVMDGEGARTPIRSLGIDVPKEGDVLQPLDLAMRKGTQTIVAGARDDVSGTLSLVRVEVANE